MNPKMQQFPTFQIEKPISEDQTVKMTKWIDIQLGITNITTSHNHFLNEVILSDFMML